MDRETQSILFHARLTQSMKTDKAFQKLSPEAKDKLENMLVNEIDNMKHPERQFVNPFYLRKLKKKFKTIVNEDRQNHPEAYENAES
jgi:hypothetical protein